MLTSVTGRPTSAPRPLFSTAFGDDGRRKWKNVIYLEPGVGMDDLPSRLTFEAEYIIDSEGNFLKSRDPRDNHKIPLQAPEVPKYRTIDD